jgi:hypothetical protein
LSNNIYNIEKGITPRIFAQVLYLFLSSLILVKSFTNIKELIESSNWII